MLAVVLGTRVRCEHVLCVIFFFFQAEDGIRDLTVTGVQTCALPICVPVINSPRTIERTVDKLWTTALLQQAGLAVPETVVCEQPDEALATFRAFGDVIVKPLFGSMGLGMVRVSDEEMAFRVFRTLETLRGVYYVQRAIDHGGCDVRAFVVGGRVLGAIERSAPAPAWKTNLARGGRARAVTLGPQRARAG